MGSSQSALNFGAGPAKLPREVLSEVQSELLSFRDSGMSLMEMSHRSADYAVTGTWSGKAAKEAAKYGKVDLVFPKADKPGSIPPESTWTLNPDASYLYYCDNETVDGVEFPYVPNSNGVPIVCDMSSSIMTKHVDVAKFGAIIAGAQKNIGPAGVTLIIVREDLLGKPMKVCPSVFDFTHINKENSVHNTPATF
ncbi:Aminotran 5 domain containing protein, partial [Asbolus verrucosus]